MFRIGVVGAGIIGASHKSALLADPDCEMTAVCDIALASAERLAEGTKARVYTDYREMAEREALDAVILNLPHFLHCDTSVFFLERGISVLVAAALSCCCKILENELQFYYGWFWILQFAVSITAAILFSTLLSELSDAIKERFPAKRRV